nr:B12-binding domain-containing radical SAM protein [Sporobacter termitidis]
MKILLVYPKIPVTYWGFQHALKFISKKAAFPPLGLITIAAMIPDSVDKKLIDLNVEKLTDRDIQWADYVFISAMVIQKPSVREILDRCQRLGVKTVGGGPLFTAERDAYGDVDHLVLNEGEITMTEFLADLRQGTPRRVYETDAWADISRTPVPQWSLLKLKSYSSLNIQYSRGCPFNCDFCDITTLFGRAPRTKTADQVLQELDAIYNTGWRGELFFVDDNFIGNKKKLLDDVLPAIIGWMERRDHPFCFMTEVSINLADDEELMKMMVKAGFNSVFIGIETPDDTCLTECQKTQNRNRDLISCVKRIQEYGIEVSGGFIVGFDNDSETIFNRMIKFIQDSGIVTAMVGLLNAPIGTKLYQRLQSEGRIEKSFTGNNTDFTMNFVPKMDRHVLENGYQQIVKTIYSPKYYYERVINFLAGYNPKKFAESFSLMNIVAFLRSIFRIGVFGRERKYYWKLLNWSLRNRPDTFPIAVRFSIYGFHFRKLYE